MAFGVKLPEENDVDVETARKIWTELAAVMKTKEFIENVKREIKEIKRRVDAEGGDAASEEQKEAVQFMAVQTEVLKAQKDVGDKLGFKGDEGYARRLAQHTVPSRCFFHFFTLCNQRRAHCERVL